MMIVKSYLIFPLFQNHDKVFPSRRGAALALDDVFSVGLFFSSQWSDVENSHYVTKELHGSEPDDLTQTETQNKQRVPVLTGKLLSLY